MVLTKKETSESLGNLENVALAFTVKTSNAETHEQFLKDYLANKKAFEEIKAQHKGKWTY